MTATNPLHRNPPAISARERRRVIAATTVGTAIEWYDFFLYAAVAGLVFNELMFGPLDGGLATVVSFLTVGLSFLFRPLGAFLAGHFGDRYGRRVVLLVTLFSMGGATAAIGLLPTYDTAGALAPLLLILLRVIQGISAGGEWGSAVLLAVEHAPREKRGLYGAGPQVGVPLGLLLSSGVLTIMDAVAPGEEFLRWGWRIPFLFSLVLVAVGYFIRMGVDESPVFKEIADRNDDTPQNPTAILLRRYGLLVVVAALIFAANNAVGYMTAGGYIQNYATRELGLPRGEVLTAVTVSGVTWLFTTLLTGWLSDKLGRRRTYLLGFAVQALGASVLFPLVNSRSLAGLYAGLIFLTVGLGLTYGQQSAMYAELFPASIRTSGVSISYALGSILGGAFAPTIAAALVNATGTTAAVSLYLVFCSAVGFLCAFLLRDRTGLPLEPRFEDQQSSGHFRFERAHDRT